MIYTFIITAGGACFPAQADLSCQYPQPGLNGKLTSMPKL